MKRLVLITIALLFFNFPVASMDTFTEDCWLGAAFFKYDSLTDSEKILPFIDIRENNAKKTSYDGRFKTVIADYVLISSLDVLKNLNRQGIDSQEKLETYLENIDYNQIKDDQKLHLELSILLKMIEEMRDNIVIIANNLPGHYYYRFFHVSLHHVEEVTKEHLLRAYDGRYLRELLVEPFEFDESKASARIFNSMLPLTYQGMAGYTNSPLLSQYTSLYTENNKNELRSRLPGSVFANHKFVDVKEIKITVNDLITIYQALDFVQTEEIEDLLLGIGVDFVYDPLDLLLVELKGGDS